MVFVDDRKIKYKGMLMCHIVSDSLEELHAMADKLGLRKYFQDKPGRPHYDICQEKKKLAIKLGAIEISSRKVIEYFKLVEDLKQGKEH